MSTANTLGIVKDLEMPRSHSLDDMVQAIQPTLEQIDQMEYFGCIDSQETSVRRKFLEQEYQCRKELLERHQARSERFFKENKIASYIKDELITPLVELSQGSRENVNDLLLALPEGPALIQGIEEIIASGEKTWGESFSPMGRVCVVIGEINNVMERAFGGFKLLQFHAPDRKDKNTLGIAQVVRGYSCSDDTYFMDFCVLEMMFPMQVLLSPLGTYDNSLSLAWVNVGGAFDEAFIEFARKTGRIMTPVGFENLIQVTSRYDSIDSFVVAIVYDALCEEVKHGLNYIRSFKEGERAHERSARFFHERLVKGHWLWDIWQFCQDDTQRYNFAKAVEEVEAKLTHVALGPDPYLAIAMMEPCLERAFRTERRFPTEWEIVAALLTDTPMAQVDRNTLHGVFELDSKDIRKKAMKALRETFIEDFANTPFCLLDEHGILHRTQKTHRVLASWAQKDDRPLLRRLASCCFEKLEKMLY